VSDLCVVPSIYEPFGLVALEAMASGCPCIVADTGGLREVVPNDAVGLRFRPSDPAALAELVATVLGDAALRRRLAAEASEHVLSFDWGEIAVRTAALYGELVDGAGRAPIQSKRS
jgi:glycogen(starch) synthase